MWQSSDEVKNGQWSDTKSIVIPSNITANDFRNAALKAGYFIAEDTNYDGFNTHWIGAYKNEEDAILELDGDEIVSGGYVIDFTRDISVSNAIVEYNLYVGTVRNIIGTSVSGTGGNYHFQMNSNTSEFGFACRIGQINILVTAGVEHRNEILAFLNAMGFVF
jgi:hypothetical protein